MFSKIAKCACMAHKKRIFHKNWTRKLDTKQQLKIKVYQNSGQRIRAAGDDLQRLFLCVAITCNSLLPLPLPQVWYNIQRRPTYEPPRPHLSILPTL